LISVTYTWKHTGHIPGSIQDMREGPSAKIIKQFIEEQVENNMTWINIKNLMRLDKDILVNVLNNDNIESIPYSINIKYNDFYYAMKKSMQKKAILSCDMEESLKLWEKRIIENENCPGHFFSRNLDSYENGMFLVAFMSAWQLKVY
jgi:hypothetical protein